MKIIIIIIIRDGAFVTLAIRICQAFVVGVAVEKVDERDPPLAGFHQRLVPDKWNCNLLLN